MISKLLNNGYLDPFDYESFTTYESCLVSKMTKSLFTEHGKRATKLLELIYSDVCGPMFTHVSGGFSYFITFTNDFSRFGYVYLFYL